MTWKQEMDQYRNSFQAKRGKRGKRRVSDHKEPKFWEIGLALDFVALFAAAVMIALTACGRAQ